MRKTWLALVLSMLAGGAARAAATPPNETAFGLGLGGDGSPTISTSGTVVNSYASLVSQDAADTITVTDGSLFPDGKLILIWQTAGFSGSIGSPNLAVDLSATGVGLRELARVVSHISANQIKVTTAEAASDGLHNSYSATNNNTQVVRVREYSSLTVGGSGSVVAQPWSDTLRVGGVVAFLVQANLAVNGGGSVNANAAGFVGGKLPLLNFNTLISDCSSANNTPLADFEARGEGVAGTTFGGFSGGAGNLSNGAGGGDCKANGGGGGGNGDQGGVGGGNFSNAINVTPGVGGAGINYGTIDLTRRLLMGGGGGAGNEAQSNGSSGRHGGGAVFIRANALTGTGSISADGEGQGAAPAACAAIPSPAPLADGQGGGGAGGDVYIRVKTTVAAGFCSGAQLTARGGNGISILNTNAGPGGGGAGGHVLLQTSSTSCTPDVSFGFRGINCDVTQTAANGKVGNAEHPPGGYCTASSDCTAQVCDDTPNTVVGNGSDPAVGTCVDCIVSADCAGGAVCNPATHTCRTCVDAADCQAAYPGDTKPLCTGGACTACSTNNDCVTATGGSLPFCNGGTCARCDAGGVSARSADLRCNTDSTKPICQGDGTCGACTANANCSVRADATPFCNLVSGGGDGSCRGCTTSTECQTDISASTPICSSGACVACGSNTVCEGAFPNQPFCSSGACLACNSGSPTQQNADLRCTVSAARPICQLNGSCGACALATECQTRASNTPICSSGACIACSGNAACDTNYPAAPVCSSGACIACSGTSDCNVDSLRPACTAGGCVRCDQSTGEAICTPSGKHCETGAASGFHGACVTCRSTNASADCSVATAVCNASDVCEACSGSNNGENACFANHSPGTPHCITGGGACVQCNSSLADCGSSKPVCGATVANTCGNCSSDNDCTGRGALHVCALSGTSTGACVGCLGNADCSQQTPHCTGDAVNPGSCAACLDDNDCTGYPAALACQPADGITNSPGQCKQCSFTNTSACTGTTPSCNFTIGACQLCTVEKGDLGAQSTGCAANPDGHACQGSGTSVFCGCTSDADCGSNTSGRICDTITNLCVDGCSRAAARNNCPAGQFCTSDDTTGTVTGVCTTTCNFDPDCAIGMPTMPFCINAGTDDGGVPDGGADGGHMGLSADGGVGRCAGCRTDSDCSGATAVCEPAKKICVECTTSESAACIATAAGTACLTNETCGCTDDSQCGATDSGRICDLLSTQKCIAGCRVTGGNGCPSGLVCNGSGQVPGSCVEIVDMAINVPDLSAAPDDLSVPVDMTQTGFKLKGGGFGCDFGGNGSSTSWGALLLLGAAMVALRLRRRVR